MLGIVICLILFVWVDSEMVAKILSKLGITFGIIALISILLGRMYVQIEKEENSKDTDS